ncbi:hypothetical protein ABFS82_08G121300 [Erythranthe guttata]|uniref:Uncharacterized protein n=1 Tax=Erythranthe guttata TaxID=4155 RepID=A0A022RSZ1_ERYGU|nr:hypothetical protein MIMGU_mgv1a026382mg [Erythranthe guttata]
MACCLCFFKASKKNYWPRIALLFAATLFSSAAFHIGVVLVLIIMFLSTLFLFTFSKQKPIILDRSLLKENDTTCDQETEIDSEENEQRLFLIGSSKDDLHSSESQSKSTTTSNNNNNTSSCEDKDEDKHSSSSSSDQWPYYINNIKGQKKLEYCSDDEESLIEIAIPSEHFVISNPDLIQKHDYNINYDQQQHMIKCCKLSAATDDHIMFHHHKEDLLAASDMINEEDSFIEIDIYMGSIKYSCSTFS